MMSDRPVTVCVRASLIVNQSDQVSMRTHDEVFELYIPVRPTYARMELLDSLEHLHVYTGATYTEGLVLKHFDQVRTAKRHGHELCIGKSLVV